MLFRDYRLVRVDESNKKQVSLIQRLFDYLSIECLQKYGLRISVSSDSMIWLEPNHVFSRANASIGSSPCF